MARESNVIEQLKVWYGLGLQTLFGNFWIWVVYTALVLSISLFISGFFLVQSLFLYAAALNGVVLAETLSQKPNMRVIDIGPVVFSRFWMALREALLPMLVLSIFFVLIKFFEFFIVGDGSLKAVTVDDVLMSVHSVSADTVLLLGVVEGLADRSCWILFTVLAVNMATIRVRGCGLAFASMQRLVGDDLRCDVELVDKINVFLMAYFFKLVLIAWFLPLWAVVAMPLTFCLLGVSYTVSKGRVVSEGKDEGK